MFLQGITQRCVLGLALGAAWETRERPLTDHTQSSAAHLAATRALAQGMPWDSDAFRAVRHVPTGT